MLKFLIDTVLISRHPYVSLSIEQYWKKRLKYTPIRVPRKVQGSMLFKDFRGQDIIVPWHYYQSPKGDVRDYWGRILKLVDCKFKVDYRRIIEESKMEVRYRKWDMAVAYIHQWIYSIFKK